MPPKFRYSVDPRALEQMAALGYPDATAQIIAMAHRSAPATTPFGNRRYGAFALRVTSDGRVLSVHRLGAAGPVRVPVTRGNTERGLGRPRPVVDETGRRLPVHTSAISCKSCNGTRKLQVRDECPECKGRGCMHCDDGQVVILVPCPAAQRGEGVCN